MACRDAKSTTASASLPGTISAAVTAWGATQRPIRGGWWFDACLKKVAWRYTTGYDSIFDNSTNRLEFTLDLWSFPIMLWGQTGYNSDLVDYYRKVDSWGITLELQSVSTHIW